MTTEKEKLLEKFDDLIRAFKKTNLNDWIDIEYALEDCDTWDEFTEYCEERIREQEIIYYHNAIAYLSENDPSLNESLGLAVDCGYSPEDLNSEILATLLLQQNLIEELFEMDNFEELFEDE